MKKTLIYYAGLILLILGLIRIISQTGSPWSGYLVFGLGLILLLLSFIKRSRN